MFTFNVDLGQLIIAGLIGLVGYFSKQAIDRVYKTLDSHDKLITELRITLAQLVGHNHKSE